MLEAAEHQLAAVHLAPVNLLQHLALGVVIALLETVPSDLGTGSLGTEQVLKQLRFTFLCIQMVGLVSHGVSPCCKRERQARAPCHARPAAEAKVEGRITVFWRKRSSPAAAGRSASWCGCRWGPGRSGRPRPCLARPWRIRHSRSRGCRCRGSHCRGG